MVYAHITSLMLFWVYLNSAISFLKWDSLFLMRESEASDVM
jgi:myosin-crossreactive antigen